MSQNEGLRPLSSRKEPPARRVKTGLVLRFRQCAHRHPPPTKPGAAGAAPTRRRPPPFRAAERATRPAEEVRLVSSLEQHKILLFDQFPVSFQKLLSGSYFNRQVRSWTREPSLMFRVTTASLLPILLVIFVEAVCATSTTTRPPPKYAHRCPAVSIAFRAKMKPRSRPLTRPN